MVRAIGRISAAGMLLAAMVFAAFALPARQAFACTVVAGYDPVAGVDLVIDGVIARVEEPDREFGPHTLEVTVSRVLKGSYDQHEVLVYFQLNDACFSPSLEYAMGKRIVLALSPSAQPYRWNSSYNASWFVDSGYDRTSHRRSLMDLFEGRRLDLLPPEVGSGGAHEPGHEKPNLVLLASASLLVSGGAALVWVQRRGGRS